MAEPYVPVGFDYAQALLELRCLLSYDQIIAFCGYENKSQVSRIIAGRVPNHPEGEAIFALYVRTFDRKPPMTTGQRAGKDVAKWQPYTLSTAA